MLLDPANFGSGMPPRRKPSFSVLRWLNSFLYTSTSATLRVTPIGTLPYPGCLIIFTP
jgi:hypothetical protein